MGTITTTDGTEIFCKDWGSGQPIVFSHGWPLSGDDWDTQLLFFLQHGYRVIAHDRRGHGHSTQTGDGHDMDHWRYRIRATTGASDAKRAAVARTQRGARYGSGTLVRRAGPNGDTWIAKWRDGGRQVQRGRGFVHAKRHVDGLTRAEAEAALGELRERVAVERTEERAAEAKRATEEEQRRTLAQVGDALIAAKRAAGRKPSTIEAYSYWLRIHIIDYFGRMPVGEIGHEDVGGFAAALERKGLAPKSRANALGTLHSLIEFAIDEEWATGEKPVKRVEKPAVAATDPDVHFFDTEEVEALLRAVPDDPLGRVERVMYLTAGMTGMGQGELFALRWRDVDWSARRIRVRRNYVRGEFGTPKSKRYRAASRSRAASPPSSSCCSRARRASTTTTSCSPTRRRATRSTARSSSSASRPPCRVQMFATFGSTT